MEVFPCVGGDRDWGSCMALQPANKLRSLWEHKCSLNSLIRALRRDGVVVFSLDSYRAHCVGPGGGTHS